MKRFAPGRVTPVIRHASSHASTVVPRALVAELVWAPELHFNEGARYVYFAAAPSRAIKDKLFQHRMYVIRNSGANPLDCVHATIMASMVPAITALRMPRTATP